MARRSLRLVAVLCASGSAPVLGARASIIRLSAAADLLSGPGWQALKTELDRLPVFTVANERGQPLEFEIDGRDKQAVFYADVRAAQIELAKAQDAFPDLGCDLIPVGLGSAYALSCEGKAVVLPATEDLVAAGAPPAAMTVGQAMPFFACFDIGSTSAEGKPMLPLFMSHADCKSAVAAAEQADQEAGLEIVGLSLPGVVERLAPVAHEEQAFSFIPRATSTKYIQEYLQG